MRDPRALGMPPFICFETLRRFLSCQGVVVPFCWITGLVALALHPVYLTLWVSWLRFDGIPVALVCSNWTCLLLGLFYVVLRRPHAPETWPGFRWREALQPSGMREYLKLGVPGILSMSEWWFWEAVCFMAGKLGTVALASHTVAYNMIPLTFMIPLGLSIGLSTRVGFLMARGDVSLAKKLVAISMLGGFCIICTYTLAVYCLADGIIAAFTSDDQVKKQAKAIWGFLCLFMVVDGMYGVQAGVLRGLGLQLSQTVSTLVGLWVPGIPAMWLCGFHWHQGLVGVWKVLPFIYVLFNGMLTACYACKDWQKMSKGIRAKADSQSEGLVPANDILVNDYSGRNSRSSIDELSPDRHLLRARHDSVVLTDPVPV